MVSYEADFYIMKKPAAVFRNLLVMVAVGGVQAVDKYGMHISPILRETNECTLVQYFK